MTSPAVRALLVDDEPLARRELRRLLAAHPQIEVADEASGVGAALAACARARTDGRRFDLLLLDVEMPDGSGFDLLEQLGLAPAVIFVTAYDHHAVRAFRAQALDYLVKPVDPRELAQALARLDERARAARGPGDRLFVKDGARVALVPIDEIRLLETAGEYSRVVYGRPAREVLSGRSVASLEAGLPAARFFRASRQHIVGLDHVARIEVTDDSRLRIHLDHGEVVTMSVRRSQAFRERFR